MSTAFSGAQPKTFSEVVMDQYEVYLDDESSCDNSCPDQWRIMLRINKLTGVMELRALGPPRLLLHFLVDSEHDVLGRIRDEATFDRIAADLIFDFFDDEDEDFETDAE